jgi:hypothetical protein
LTPTKVAHCIVELVNDMQLDQFSILAAAGAGTVALACAKLLETDRLRSVGIIAGELLQGLSLCACACVRIRVEVREGCGLGN